MQNRAFDLMKEWCDTLLSYKVNTNTPYTNNALLCPACHVIHGRIADLCFPLTVIWEKTGDESYLEEADRLIDWSEYNLKTMDGLWYNDITNRWYATSAFSAMSIGEAIFNFGEKLPEKYKNKWMDIFTRMCETFCILDTRDSFKPVSNYYCGMSAVLAMAYRLTGDKKYLDKTSYWIDVVLSRFDSDGLFFGEGYPMISESGKKTVDMGYNLEESLPLLLRYADLTGDRKELFKQKMLDHLEFLLPDGAIDDSFGSRHNKWTYWGSRTSDGLIEGLSLLLDDPMCADACERVLSLYEKCTHNGLLAMPMAHEQNEPTCLHHTFCHAKALASLVCAKPVEVKRGKLPCENKYGIKSYQEGSIVLVSTGKWRATLSSSDASFLNKSTANGGGSLNLLYHDDFGIICAATSAEYYPTEITNQQYLRNSPNPPSMTAQFLIDGIQACYDKNVKLTAEESTVTATAEKWSARYSFFENELNVTLTCNKGGIYNLPIVCSKNEKVNVSDDKLNINIGDKLKISSSVPLDCDPKKRIFNQVGGLNYLPISVNVNGIVEITVS